MSYVESIINELLLDDNAIQSTINEEEKKEHDQRVWNVYELLNTTETTRKVFYKTCSNLSVTQTSNSELGNCPSLTKCAYGVVNQWIEDELNNGSNTIGVRNIFNSPNASINSRRGSLVNASKTSTSLSTNDNHDNGSNVLFSWSTTADGTVIENTTPENAVTVNQESNQTDKSRKDEDHVTNGKLFQIAHTYLTQLSRSEITKRHNSTASKNTVSADEAAAYSLPDTKGKNFKVDPFLEFRPMALKPQRDPSLQTSKSNKRKSKSIGTWLWGSSGVKKGSETEVTSDKNQKNGDSITKFDFNLIDVSADSHNLAASKSGLSVKNKQQQQQQQQQQKVKQQETSIKQDNHLVEQTSKTAQESVMDTVDDDDDDFAEFESVEFEKQNNTPITTADASKIPMQLLQPKKNT